VLIDDAIHLVGFLTALSWRAWDGGHVRAADTVGDARGSTRGGRRGLAIAEHHPQVGSRNLARRGWRDPARTGWLRR